MKINTIIFDWAGTTVDYGCFAPVEAFALVFKSIGIEPTVDEIRGPMGMLKLDHIKTMLAMERIQKLFMEKYNRLPEEKDAVEMYQQFESHLLSILHQYADPKPFVVETVNKLRDKGFKIGSTTGYTDIMMNIVAPEAKKRGYAPDFWVTPDTTKKGRPYPYMIYRNMEALDVSSVQEVIKVGDTISDIKEGVHAGVISVGIIQGSSELALNEKEYNALTQEDKELKSKELTKRYIAAGADYVIEDIRDLESLLEEMNIR